MTEWVTGTMLWLNLNSAKTKDLPSYVRTTRSLNSILQTYVIHNKIGLRQAQTEVWWTYQSNVYGVVTAVNDLPKSSIYTYPKHRGAVIELFVPDVEITAADFEETAYLDITQFSGRHKETLLAELEHGFFRLMDYYRSKQQRNDLRYAGRSYGLISMALIQCRESSEDSDDCELDGTIWELLGFQTTHKRCRVSDASEWRVTVIACDLARVSVISKFHIPQRIFAAFPERLSLVSVCTLNFTMFAGVLLLVRILGSCFCRMDYQR